MAEEKLINEAVNILRTLKLDETIHTRVHYLPLSKQEKKTVITYIEAMLNATQATPNMLHELRMGVWELRMGVWECPICNENMVKYGSICEPCKAESTFANTITTKGIDISEVSNE